MKLVITFLEIQNLIHKKHHNSYSFYLNYIYKLFKYLKWTNILFKLSF